MTAYRNDIQPAPAALSRPRRDLRDRRHRARLGPAGGPLPGGAPVAKQQGKYVAKLIRARVRSTSPRPFRYRHLGNLATIGRKAAVADFGRLRLSGRVAWLLWGLVRVYFLIGFRNRLTVLLDWFWNYVTFQRGTRLITGPTP